MSVKYKIHNPNGIYFLTYATVNWVDIFTREQYFDIVVDSLKHCQEQKELVIYAWCLMTNHVHLIASASDDKSKYVPLVDIMHDHKKFTSSQLIKTVKENPVESRRALALALQQRQKLCCHERAVED